MKLELLLKKEYNLKYLVADVRPRFWKNADVNGNEENEENPLIPCKENDRWVIKIDVDNGQIVNWKKGITASTHYKVCDNGHYILLDKDGNVIKKVESYVPDILSIDDNGYGDYLCITINEDGFIDGWECDSEDIDTLISNDFNFGK